MLTSLTGVVVLAGWCFYQVTRPTPPVPDDDDDLEA